MLIILIPKENKEELRHGLFGTTKKRKNAKYIEKIKMPNGKYRYFYNNVELTAYNMARKASKAVDNATDAAIDASGRKYYKKADKIQKEITAADKSYNKAVKKLEQLEDEAAKRSATDGPNAGVPVYNEKEQKEFDKALDEFKAAEQTKKQVEKNKKKLADLNKKGDESLYGKTKQTVKSAKKLIKKGKKKIADLLKN